MKSVDAERPPI